MKILEIIQTLCSGGAERFVVDLSNELAKENDVTLVCLQPIEGHYAFYKNDVSSKVNLLSLNVHSRQKLKAMIKLRNLIINISPDVVHTHCSAINYILPSLSLKNLEYYHTVHNVAIEEAGNIIGKLIRKFVFKHNLVEPITISPDSHKSFKDFYKKEALMIFNGRNIPTKLCVSNEVLDEINLYKTTNTTKVLTCLARIMPVKRQDLLTSVANRLQSDGYDFIVLMIGNNRNLEMVKKIKEQNCSCVYILGERHNPLEYLKVSDAFCLPSLFEGLPISLIESLGVGCIPICTPVGGITNLVKSGINGFLAKDLSEDAYYKVLKTFLDLSSDEYTQIKMNSIDSYKPFSMTCCAESYFNVFSDRMKR